MENGKGNAGGYEFSKEPSGDELRFNHCKTSYKLSSAYEGLLLINILFERRIFIFIILFSHFSENHKDG